MGGMMDATIYRLAARALFAPFGGLASVRRHAVDATAVRPGNRVLELGCGPGEITAALLARGASIDAVDASGDMLRAARVHAPGASYTQSDILSYTPARQYDAILLAFVLHELPAAELPRLLAALANDLVDGGRLVILDHALPSGWGRGIWRRILHGIESPAVDRWLAFDAARVLQDAGLEIVNDQQLAGGRARLTTAARR
jgi:demethylmenaquinone methyltransferase/2-methoxy-6-polyprenyl-1,4-benzoquinol methylase